MRRDAVEIASSELLNRRHMQGIEGIEGKAIAVWMDRPVPWKSPVEHGGAWLRNTGSPAGLKPKEPVIRSQTWWWIECGIGASPYLVGLEAWFRNSGTPAGFKPKGLPLGRQSRCRLAPSNPLKTKLDGWGGRH